MKIYIVILKFKSGYNYMEESEILAVVDLKEKAEEIANDYDNCEIQEWEVE